MRRSLAAAACALVALVQTAPADAEAATAAAVVPVARVTRGSGRAGTLLVQVNGLPARVQPRGLLTDRTFAARSRARGRR